MDRKRELKAEYREMRPTMGVIVFRRSEDGACFVAAVPDVKSRINRYRFQLNNGSHPRRGLQRAWNESGSGGFVIEVLETLEYDKDGLKTDYSEDLQALEQLWIEKLTGEGTVLFAD